LIIFQFTNKKIITVAPPLSNGGGWARESMNSKSLIADSKETLACVFLSFALLIGLGVNYLFGFWQADPIVGLAVVIFLSREGYETLKEASFLRRMS